MISDLTKETVLFATTIFLEFVVKNDAVCDKRCDSRTNTTTTLVTWSSSPPSIPTTPHLPLSSRRIPFSPSPRPPILLPRRSTTLLPATLLSPQDALLSKLSADACVCWRWPWWPAWHQCTQNINVFLKCLMIRRDWLVSLGLAWCSEALFSVCGSLFMSVYVCSSGNFQEQVSHLTGPKSLECYTHHYATHHWRMRDMRRAKIGQLLKTWQA